MNSQYSYSGNQIPTPGTHSANGDIPDNKQMPGQMYGQKTRLYPNGNAGLQTFQNTPSPNLSLASRFVPNGSIIMGSPLKMLPHQNLQFQQRLQTGQNQQLPHQQTHPQAQQAHHLQTQVQHQSSQGSPNHQNHQTLQNTPNLQSHQTLQSNQALQNGQSHQNHQSIQTNQNHQALQNHQTHQLQQHQLQQQYQLQYQSAPAQNPYRPNQALMDSRLHQNTRDDLQVGQAHQFALSFPQPGEDVLDSHQDLRYAPDSRVLQNGFLNKAAPNYMGHSMPLPAASQMTSVFSLPHDSSAKSLPQNPSYTAPPTTLKPIEEPQRSLPLESDKPGPISSAALTSLPDDMPLKTKFVPAIMEDGIKRKRGRPKKFILDPSTNQYIDSSHENYKRLNRIHKESMDAANKSDAKEGTPGFIAKGTSLGSLNDQAVKQLLEKKDRRGRPRKFPIEQTGVTIKGVRVNGTLKRRKPSTPTLEADGITKRKRGRPKRIPDPQV